MCCSGQWELEQRVYVHYTSIKRASCIGGIAMKLEILKNEEKRMNMIMFLVLLIIPAVAFFYVLLFNGGSVKDIIVLVMPICGILIKLFESRLGKYAKYLYLAVLPAFGAVTIIVGNDGVFGAFPEAYVWSLMLAIPYYDLSTIKTTALATVVPNAIGLIFFSDAYLKMRTLSIWIFILMVYTLAILVAVLIVLRARELFTTVEQKENEAEKLLNNVKQAFEGLQQSSEEIYASLHEFECNTQEIAASTEEISNSADIQIKEVSGSLSIFQELNNKIANSEERVSKTVETMTELKAKNDEGIAAIQELAEKFDENIKATQTASEGVTALSQKSTSIGGIIESISQIARQTNLLALNAAIEAARAGEVGKGFAVVADEINTLSSESSDATQKIDAILKDIIATVETTNKVIEYNNVVVQESHVKLNDTVTIFETMLGSSEEVIKVTEILKEELANIVAIKERLLAAMKKVEEISEKSADTTNEISASTEEQVAGIDSIMRSMELMHQGMQKLSDVLNRS